MKLIFLGFNFFDISLDHKMLRGEPFVPPPLPRCAGGTAVKVFQCSFTGFTMTVAPTRTWRSLLVSFAAMSERGWRNCTLFTIWIIFSPLFEERGSLEIKILHSESHFATYLCVLQNFTHMKIATMLRKMNVFIQYYLSLFVRKAVFTGGMF